MSIEKQRKKAIRSYIKDLVELVLDIEPILTSESQYNVDLHVRKIRDKLDEISTT